MSKKILIIDDDQDAISFVQTILKDHGYESVGSLSSTTALDTARSEKPNLILLDLFMPGKSGIGLFKELKEDPELKHIPVVIVSGMPQVTGVDVTTFIGRQIHTSPDGEGPGSPTPEGLVDKPIEPDRLVRTIKAVLDEGNT